MVPIRPLRLYFNARCYFIISTVQNSYVNFVYLVPSTLDQSSRPRLEDNCYQRPEFLPIFRLTTEGAGWQKIFGTYSLKICKRAAKQTRFM